MKRAAVIAWALVFALLLPVVLMGLLLGLSEEQLSPSEQALEDIPHGFIGIYQAAASTCEGLDWTILAAIHKVETNFGSGPATSDKGAQGPMQFMPATFAAYGVDGDGDGVADTDDLEDAIFSAANYLCANGAGDPERLATAVWNYNHSQAYVNEVLTLAASYGVIAFPSGAAFAGTSEVLKNPRIILSPNARADLESGVVDGRVVSLLSWLAERHTITISVFKTGHSKYTRSGRISHHYYGRAVDISIVDGSPVSALNGGARQVVLEIASLQGPLRPDELGHPFGAIGFSGGFTDADHANHLHLGFERTSATQASGYSRLYI